MDGRQGYQGGYGYGNRSCKLKIIGTDRNILPMTMFGRKTIEEDLCQTGMCIETL